MEEAKKPTLDHEVHQLVSNRWSPYIFADLPVKMGDLLSLFEAARWAPSAYNEQPWRYIVATREQGEEFSRLLSCLVEPNQQWARNASVLVLGVVSLQFEQNGKPNKLAHHDLGLASENLVLEAGNRGLLVHQMSGIIPELAREIYAIPQEFEALTALAIGFPGTPEGDLGSRDLTPRSRRPVAEFLFSGTFGNPLGDG